MGRRTYCEVVLQPACCERERVCAVLPYLLHLRQRRLRRLQRVVGVDREPVDPGCSGRHASAAAPAGDTLRGRAARAHRAAGRRPESRPAPRRSGCSFCSASRTSTPATRPAGPRWSGGTAQRAVSARAALRVASARRAHLRRADGRDPQRNAFAERVVRVALWRAAVHLRSPGAGHDVSTLAGRHAQPHGARTPVPYGQ